MNKMLPVSACVLMLCLSAGAQNERMHGTWRLVSAVTTIVGTGESLEPFGPSPSGYITYGPESRMQVLIVAGQRPKPSQSAIADMPESEAKELLRTMTAYGGRYSFDGITLTHHIDIAWNAVWAGTDQMRDVSFEEDKVTLTTRLAPNPRDGRMSTTALTWERVK